MNWYESMVILNPALNDEEIKSAIDKVSEQITKSDGEVFKADNWGRRKLSYELFKAPSATIGKIESFFKVFDPVLKFMVIRLGSKQIEALPKDVLGVTVAAETGVPEKPETSEGAPQVVEPSAEVKTGADV